MLIISALTKNRLLTTTGNRGQYYIPVQSLENITLKMILDAVRSAEESPNLRPEDVESVDKIDETIEQLNNAISTAVENKNLKDLI